MKAIFLNKYRHLKKILFFADNEVFSYPVFTGDALEPPIKVSGISLKPDGAKDVGRLESTGMVTTQKRPNPRLQQAEPALGVRLPHVKPQGKGSRPAGRGKPWFSGRGSRPPERASAPGAGGPSGPRGLGVSIRSLGDTLTCHRTSRFNRSMMCLFCMTV